MVSEVVQGDLNDSEGILEARTTRFRRNIFTGELEEVPSEGGGRQILYRGSAPKHYNPKPVGTPNYDRVCRPLSLKPEEATPQRIEAENEAARKYGSGAWFDKKGQCHTSTRGSQNREMKRRGDMGGTPMANFDAGYGDYMPR